MESSAPDSEKQTTGITRWLESSSLWVFSLYAIVVSFTTYFCMYGFTKAFAAAKFSEEMVSIPLIGGEIELKAALVMSQLLGYASSKFIGIKVLSELQHHRRIAALIGCILMSELALVGVGAFSGFGKVAAIFFNGLPLGVVWGLVYSYLEGRRTSELLGAGLSCSFIVASGFAKTVGTDVVDSGVSEQWMPAVAGLYFFPPFLIAAWLLNKIPAPSKADVEARVQRAPMNSKDRWKFMSDFALGLFFLLVLYFFLTAYRDFRDNFAVEILTELGLADSSNIFTKTELPIAFIVLASVGGLFLIRDNRRGFLGAHLLMASGTILIGVSTLMFDFGWIDGFYWMVLNGLGAFLAYVPFNCILFDRLIAAMKTVATAVFTIYMADALGYVGVIVVLLFQQNLVGDMPKLDFFRNLSYFTSILCTLCFIVSAIYFARKRRG